MVLSLPALPFAPSILQAADEPGPIDAGELSFLQLQQRIKQYGPKLASRELVANINWSLQYLVETPLPERQALLEQTWQLLQPNLEQFAPQLKPKHWAQIMLTCSKLRYGKVDVYKECMGAFVAQLQQSYPRRISNAVYAVAASSETALWEECWPAIEEQLLPAFLEMLDSANTQDISNVMYAAAEMGKELAVEPMLLLLKSFAERLQEADPQSLSVVFWAAASAGVQPFLPEALLTSDAVQEILRKVPIMQVRDVHTIVWACATIGYRHDPLMAVCFEKAVNTLRLDAGAWVESQPHGPSPAVMLCWAAAVLDMRVLIPHVMELAEACSRQWDKLPRESKQALYQVHRWVLDLQRDGSVPAVSRGCLTKEHYIECRKLWNDWHFEMSRKEMCHSSNKQCMRLHVSCRASGNHHQQKLSLLIAFCALMC